MSERMTLERLNWFRMQRSSLEAHGLRIEEHLAELHDETERARASEDQKEAVIKALADALDGLHQVAFRGPDEQKGGPGQETYYNWRDRIRLEAEDIHRLVGRLP